MTKIKIKLLAFQGAPDAVFEKAANRVEKLISTENYKLTESNPDVLFFLSGGSEKLAMEQVSKGHFYVLIGSQHDNSYASATEVKAYLNAMNIPSLLLDEEVPETKALLKDFLIVKKALKSLNDKKLGLIGQISDWLISSAIPSALLKEKLGIRLIKIPWNKLTHFSEFKASDDFLGSFSGKKQFDLTETAKVSEMLTDTIQKWHLDAITVNVSPWYKETVLQHVYPWLNSTMKAFLPAAKVTLRQLRE